MRIQRVHMRPEVESKRAAIISQSDVFGRHHYLDGRLDLAIGCWDKVADRQTLNRFEAQFPLAKENTQARVCSASMPPSPQKRRLELQSSVSPYSFDSANLPLARSACVACLPHQSEGVDPRSR